SGPEIDFLRNEDVDIMEYPMQVLLVFWILQSISPLSDAQNDLRNGRIAEGVHKLAELVSRQPDDIAARHLFITTLIKAGLGDAARDEARRCVADAPQLPAAHHALGYSLTHDAVGREFRPGFDWNGAHRELRAAFDLAPGDISPRR